MKKKIGLLFYLFIFSHLTTAVEFNPKTSNIIFITIDGVRWKDIVSVPDPSIDPLDGQLVWPYFQTQLLSQGVFLGNRHLGSQMKVSNLWHISLPGYYNIFSGRRHECIDNSCGRIPFPTFPERLIKELHLSRQDVASFASWHGILWAVEQVEGATWTDGPVEEGQERPDEITYAHAMEHLKLRPRFLYVSLNDSDALAHQKDYAGHIQALRRFDRWMKELMTTLKSMGDYGARTTVIITTDHGRGNGSNWYEHLPFMRGSGEIWLFAIGPDTPRLGYVKNTKVRTQLDIRPTIERFFGLSPVSEGALIAELFFPQTAQ